MIALCDITVNRKFLLNDIKIFQQLLFPSKPLNSRLMRNSKVNLKKGDSPKTRSRHEKRSYKLKPIEQWQFEVWDILSSELMHKWQDESPSFSDFFNKETAPATENQE